MRVFAMLIFTVINCQAQLFQFENIPVESNSTNVTMPWAGGLNAVQINTFDIDRDGIDDIITFEKMTNQILPFLVKNNQYQFAPEYAALFPDNISGWMLLRDFNHDGKKDIFTSHPLGARVFVNTSKNAITWRKFSDGNYLLTTTTNLPINSGDLPVVDDIDGDGDYDILNPRFTGSGGMEWHKNMSLELTGKTDTLIYRRATRYWGGFTECSCANFRYEAEADCSSGGRIQHAAGKSLLVIDANADGLRDLLFTEEDCNRLYLLPNQGTNEEPQMKSFSIFHENNPVDIPFPASYYEDINRDGLKDLAVTSTISARNFIKNDFRSTVWLYQNSGTNERPVFTFVKNNLLQENMIDVGTNSCPAFYDADNDGDDDLFVSHFGNSKNIATIWFFENVGDAQIPSFKFISDDYASLSSKKFFALKIQFSDMDRDGIKDLVFSSYTQTTSQTNINYIKNKSVKLDLANDITDLNMSIAAGENFCAVDVNEDGQKDLLIGKSNGAVQYWENRGKNNFVLKQDNYLNLGSSIVRYSPSLCVADIDLDRKSDLLVGNSAGTFSVFYDFRTATTSQLGKILNHRTKEYEAMSLGKQLTIASSYLLNGKPTIVFGSSTGGLRLLGLLGDSKRAPTVQFFAYPNSMLRGGILKLQSNVNGVVRFYNVLGQEIGGEFILNAYEVLTVAPDLSQGTNFVKFCSEKKNITLRIMVLE